MMSAPSLEEITPAMIGDRMQRESAERREALRQEIESSHNHPDKDNFHEDALRLEDMPAERIQELFPDYVAWLHSQEQVVQQADLSGFFASFLVGAVLMAGVLVFRLYRNVTVFKAMSSDMADLLYRIGLAAQCLWVLVAIVIVSDMSNSVLHLRTMALMGCVLMPVITIHTVNWIIRKRQWHGAVFAACLLWQGVIASAFRDDFQSAYDDKTAFMASMMMLVFCVFYILQNAQSLWAYISNSLNRKHNG